MDEFKAINEFEKALLKTQDGLLPLRAFLGMMLCVDVAVPSLTEMQADGSNLAPIVYDREGVSRIAIFTDKERVSVVSEKAKFLLLTNGYDFIRRIPQSLGLVINPGYQVGFEMSPEGVAQLMRDVTA